MLPHDDDYTALSHFMKTNIERQTRRNGNKIKKDSTEIEGKARVEEDNNDLKILGNESKKHKG